MTVLMALLSLAACSSLALSQERNWKIVTPGSQANRARLALRYQGWLLLGGVLALAIASEGPGFAVLLWILLAALASLLVALSLTFRPVLFRPVAQAASRLFP